jgi:hypothetical protein
VCLLQYSQRGWCGVIHFKWRSEIGNNNNDNNKRSLVGAPKIRTVWWTILPAVVLSMFHIWVDKHIENCVLGSCFTWIWEHYTTQTRENLFSDHLIITPLSLLYSPPYLLLSIIYQSKQEKGEKNNYIFFYLLLVDRWWFFFCVYFFKRKKKKKWMNDGGGGGDNMNEERCRLWMIGDGGMRRRWFWAIPVINSGSDTRFRNTAN